MSNLPELAARRWDVFLTLHLKRWYFQIGGTIFTEHAVCLRVRVWKIKNSMCYTVRAVTNQKKPDDWRGEFEKYIHEDNLNKHIIFPLSFACKNPAACVFFRHTVCKGNFSFFRRRSSWTEFVYGARHHSAHRANLFFPLILKCKMDNGSRTQDLCAKCYDFQTNL